MVIEQVINYLTGADLMIIGFNIYSDLKALDLGQIVLIDNKIIDLQKYFSSKFCLGLFFIIVWVIIYERPTQRKQFRKGKRKKTKWTSRNDHENKFN